ncbi:MAG: hypothetical protein HAW67_07220 [Endozoicomonadaceae bacterium]|nr:hypothetical protein [Endozoicomonadaceae bacterium]
MESISINRLFNNGYIFRVDRLPKLSYHCQDVQFPAVFFGDASLATPLQNTPVPGDKMFYDSLKLEFSVDDKLFNYKELYKWIIAMGFPQDNTQYENFIQGKRIQNEAARNANDADTRLRQNQTNGPPNISIDVFQNLYSRGVLQFLDANKLPASTVIFVDLFPVSLTMQNVSSTVGEVAYTQAVVEFKFQHYYYLEDVRAAGEFN